MPWEIPQIFLVDQGEFLEKSWICPSFSGIFWQLFVGVPGGVYMDLCSKNQQIMESLQVFSRKHRYLTEGSRDIDKWEET